MKIKIKDEMNDIRLKLSHKEVVLIKNALSNLNTEDLDDLNLYLFDCQEYKNKEELEKDIEKMSRKMYNKLNKIIPW